MTRKTDSYEEGKRAGRLEREDEMRATCQKACAESVELRQKLNAQYKSNELIAIQERERCVKAIQEYINADWYGEQGKCFLRKAVRIIQDEDSPNPTKGGVHQDRRGLGINVIKQLK